MNKKMIYAVEDDEGIGEVYRGAFEDDYDIRLFEDGPSFLEAFRAGKPDIVILDIMLPDMDGYTVLSEIRKLDERIPVIIVSAKSDEISFVKGLNKGGRLHCQTVLHSGTDGTGQDQPAARQSVCFRFGWIYR